eukprot:CAMPEP_0183706424 /NCGR_PEP_ID=MMETSP0737-20130205/3264_1 /TAXON_ID=385413 /ORGANISM="Thalassiosira miniscula, Strain CCMP1093" /LENGTH=196 /DNA_ID=CAMNT_0025933837 /DNA_START=368 /DNA_END=958 /DNA_ORIENTATION=-
MCTTNQIPPRLEPMIASSAVNFSSVTIREYPRILGDNPSVSSGPPITISWDYDADTSGRCTIDEWESKRDGERRTKNEFRVPEDVRTDWVLDAGYTLSQVREVLMSIQKEKRERRTSIEKSMLQDKADVVAESFRRRVARAVGKREKSDALYTKWKSSSDLSLQGPEVVRKLSLPTKRKSTNQKGAMRIGSRRASI